MARKSNGPPPSFGRRATKDNNFLLAVPGEFLVHKIGRKDYLHRVRIVERRRHRQEDGVVSGTPSDDVPVVGSQTDKAPASEVSPGALPNDFGDEPEGENDAIIREIVSIEREMYFERRHSKTERQRRLKEVIERNTKIGEG
jgi:hypothetical protein